MRTDKKTSPPVRRARTFNAFLIEGRGTVIYPSRQSAGLLSWWVAPDRLRIPVAQEELWNEFKWGYRREKLEYKEA